MRFEPKRFVVEVKRGTSRSTFMSADPSRDRFGAAEAALFGPGSAHTAPTQGAKATMAPPRRILESLIEDPTPEVEATAEPDRPRRGRKPGSKNKPKPAFSAIETDALEAASHGPDPVLAAPPPREVPGPTETVTPIPSGSTRQRLRDRSTILKRYVLGTERAAGDIGGLRARRRARSGR